MPKKLNWARFLSAQHLARLLFVYAAFMFTGGVLTFAIYFAIERPEVGLSFLAGAVCGVLTAMAAIWTRSRKGDERPTNFMERIHNLSHV
jgi:F0F1-type ATP synthase assembly protein I